MLDEDNESCLILGPTRLSGSAIASAQATRSQLRPALQLVFTETGIDGFNQMAAECFAMIGGCGTGMVAIVESDRLVSAPLINAERFERDQIVITPPIWDADWVERMAETING